MRNAETVVDDSEVEQSASEDFRQRSARRRRERMRARLLDATLEACSERGSRNVSLQDILEAADVSRGTFYAHFESLHDAISIIGRRLIDKAQAENIKMYEDVVDPLLRIAVGPQLFLTRAILQPAWASTIVESGEISLRSTFVMPIRRDIVSNIRAKNFIRTDVQVAVDLHVGAMLQGARTLQKRASMRAKAKYIRDLDYNLLLAFGIKPAAAVDAVDRAAADLRERAPKMLKWWRELD